MDETDRKERFSLAYISAVAAHAGYQVVEGRPIDKDNVDGHFEGDEGRRPRLEFQAKATAAPVLRPDHLVFPLPRKNYDDLRADVRVPRLLIVVVLPASEEEWLIHSEEEWLIHSEEEWLIHSEEELRLRRCGYWLSLAGWPATTNVATISVAIPRAHVFDTAQLRALITRADRREPL